jgi:tetratricopeptide (TPR) repeat protein
MEAQPRKIKKRRSSNSGRYFRSAWFAMPALISILLYANTLGHQWCLDDYSVIVDNWVTKKGWEGIPLHLQHDYRYGYWGVSQGDLYRPLSLVMFAAEWAIWGDHPLPGHVINVLLYGLLCFGFGYVLYLWSRRPTLSMLAALLFAVHPVHTEVVANIKSRDELLSFLFLMLAWWAWQRLQHHQPSALYIGAGMAAFFLALLAKESALTFLPLFPLSILLFRQKPARMDYLQTLWLLLPAGIFLTLRQVVLGSVRGLDKVSVLDNVLSGAGDTPTALASALRHIGEYLRILVAPWPLSSDKGWNQIPLTGFDSVGVWISLLAIAAGLYGIYWFWRRNKLVALGLVWFVCTFSLAANLLFLIGTSYGERLLFLPSAGFSIAVAALLVPRGGSRGPWPQYFKQRSGWVFAGVLLVFATLSVLRNPAWYDSYTLYSTDIQHSPESVKLRYHYALETGKKAADLPESPEREALLRQAMTDLERVLDKHPVYWEAHSTAGLYAFRLGEYERALMNYEEAVRLNPNAAIAWSNMGIIHAERGDLDRAADVYGKSVVANPRFVDGWMNLGAIRAQRGQYEGALEAFLRGLELDPTHPHLRAMTAAVYRDLGQPEEAARYE